MNLPTLRILAFPVSALLALSAISARAVTITENFGGYTANTTPATGLTYSFGFGHEQGAASLLVGVSANRSLATERPVRIADIAALKPEARHRSQLI